jgi:hypothetical protein
LNLTYESPIWDPYLTDFSHQEEKFTDSKGVLVTRNSAHANSQMVTTRDSTVSMVLSSVSMLLEDKHLIDELEKTCIVSVAQFSIYRYKVMPEELAKRWNIGLLTAKRTLLATTQRGVKDIASQLLAKRVKPVTSQLRYCHLRTSLYMCQCQVSPGF